MNRCPICNCTPIIYQVIGRAFVQCCDDDTHLLRVYGETEAAAIENWDLVATTTTFNPASG